MPVLLFSSCFSSNYINDIKIFLNLQFCSVMLFTLPDCPKELIIYARFSEVIGSGLAYQSKWHYDGCLSHSLIFPLFLILVVSLILISKLYLNLASTLTFCSTNRLKGFHQKNLLPEMIWFLHCQIEFKPSRMELQPCPNKLVDGQLQLLAQK